MLVIDFSGQGVNPIVANTTSVRVIYTNNAGGIPAYGFQISYYAYSIGLFIFFSFSFLSNFKVRVNIFYNSIRLNDYLFNIFSDQPTCNGEMFFSAPVGIISTNPNNSIIPSSAVCAFFINVPSGMKLTIVVESYSITGSESITVSLIFYVHHYLKIFSVLITWYYVCNFFFVFFFLWQCIVVY